jgi:hypothetical protein
MATKLGNSELTVGCDRELFFAPDLDAAHLHSARHALLTH